jgi:hypothetical protein
MEWVMENKEAILQIVTGVIAVAAAVAAVTPNTKDEGIVGKLQSLINKLALNVGNAKNKDE